MGQQHKGAETVLFASRRRGLKGDVSEPGILLGLRCGTAP